MNTLLNILVLATLTASQLVFSQDIEIVTTALTECDKQFTQKISTILDREVGKSIVKFSLQDDKKLLYEYYLKLQKQQQQERLKAAPNILSRLISKFTQKKELSLKQSEIYVLPDISAPREMTFPKVRDMGHNPILIKGDMAIVSYAGYPDTNELEIRNLQTGRLINSLEWDEPEFGMFDIDDFILSDDQETIILWSNSFFGKTSESKDKDVFVFWNYKTGDKKTLYIDKNFTKGNSDYHHGGSSSFYSKLSSAHPYFLRGHSPVSDNVNVQILNYKSQKGLAISDASYRTYSVMGFNQSHFNEKSKYMLYLRKHNDGKEFALLPFHMIEKSMADGNINLKITGEVIAEKTLKESSKIIPRFFEHSSRLQSVSASPSGKFILSATVAGDISLWNAISGHKIKEIKIESNEADISFSPDESIAMIFDRKTETYNLIPISNPSSLLQLSDVNYDVKSTVVFKSNTSGFYYINKDQQLINIELDQKAGFISSIGKFEFKYQQLKYFDNRSQKMFLDSSDRYLISLSRKRDGFNAEYWLEAYDLKENKYVGNQFLTDQHSFSAYRVSSDKQYLIVTSNETELTSININLWIEGLIN